MAGKSPDRSEQQMSSGETTGKTETVPERVGDPRVALQEPPRKGAGADGETSGEADRKPREAAGEADTGDEEREPADESRDGADEPADDSPERNDATEGPGSEEPGSEESGAADGAEPEAPEGKGSADEAEKSEPEVEPESERPVDRTTAVFRVPKDESGDAAEDDAEKGTEEGSEKAGKPEKAGKAEAEAESEPEGPVDQATAVFRVPEDGTGTKGDDEKAEDGDAKPAEDTKPTKDAGTGKDTKPTEDGKVVDQPTAMFRAVRPKADPEPSGKAAATAAAAIGVADKPTTGEDEAGEPEESDAERTSRFVPLRSSESPATSESRPLPELPETERTRQQPLPPHKPLELLAELTNKPAPPPTPLRTALRRIKIWSPLVVLLAIVLSVVQLLRPLPEPKLVLTAPATYSFDGDKPSLAWPPEGQAVVEVEGLGSLGSYGEQKPVPIASVAKTMTAYVILRDHPLKMGEEGPQIPVDQRAEDEASLPGESTVPVEKGEKITLREALNALMLASANNVARLLARWDAGSEEAFVEKMNAAAKELGMNDTTYTDPSGLEKETVSTAADQVKLGKKVMDHEVFREIVNKPSYDDRNGVNHRNWNGLVPYNGAVGIKTGTSTAAGGNLLFAAEKEIGGTTQLIVGAVLGQYRPAIIDTVIAESRELMISVQEALESETIIKKGDVVGYVDDGLGGRTQLVATEDVTAVGWPGMETELALTDGGKGVPHEAAAGETVGTLTVGSGPGQVKVPVAVRGELAEPGVGAKLTRVL